MSAKKSVSTKAVALLLAVVLLIGCTIGGTLAWLMTKSSTVTNTFVAGEIGTLTLAETTGDSYIVTPGVDIKKDPVVTFNGNNVAAYVFVEVTAADWTSDAETHMSYSMVNGKVAFSIDSGWGLVDGTNNVYYKSVGLGEQLENVSIIADNKITVSSELTKGEMTAKSSLEFTAYAIQQADGGTENDGKFTPAEAWAQIKADLNIQ